MTEILRLIDIALNLFEAGSAAYERFNELRGKLTAMQAEGRDPTPAEWDELFDGIESNSARLDAADKMLNP